jgi:hypothetical protein
MGSDAMAIFDLYIFGDANSVRYLVVHCGLFWKGHVQLWGEPSITRSRVCLLFASTFQRSGAIVEYFCAKGARLRSAFISGEPVERLYILPYRSLSD